ncbi:hypothetical protein LAZ67_3001138 [Cordylochernes scorpioides]|uniref:Mos1 transposase HTH domain-containing protein n=1 Tax=Cordylochernes scorpioides TaxID=51811 RepID=A0ABY6K7M2_9ARAC|nr:hypothetical protein LAZ67_3001138 [Cordylochernes scorpioides]
MVTKTNSCAKYEMRAVIRFLYHEGVKPFEIYSRMKALHGNKFLSQNRIFEWVRKFKSGIESLGDAPRPGAPVKVSDDATTWAIDEMIQNDHHISIRVIFAELNLSYGSVPRLLTKEMKEKRLNACKELLEHYEIEGEGFLDRIVTGDESWIHHHIPDSKGSSAEWHHKGSPTSKMFFLNSFKKIKPKIRSKRLGLLSKGVCLQHDNAQPHVANLTVDTNNKLNFKL